MPRFVSTLLIAAVLLLSAGSVSAQVQIGWLVVKGAKSPILSFQTTASAGATNGGAGRPPQQSQEQPVTITRLVDGASSGFSQALFSNLQLGEVSILLFNKKAGQPDNTPCLTINLADAFLSKITLLEGAATGNRQLPENQLLEEISFSYKSASYVFPDKTINH